MSTPVCLIPSFPRRVPVIVPLSPDIQEKDILLQLDNTSVLEAFEEAERTSPTARKVIGDRTVYQSRKITMSPREYGPPTLYDFGEARFGHSTYMDFVQPDQYRAPEVLLGIPWNEKVDIWSVGVMVWRGTPFSLSGQMLIVRSHL